MMEAEHAVAVEGRCRMPHDRIGLLEVSRLPLHVPYSDESDTIYPYASPCNPCGEEGMESRNMQNIDPPVIHSGQCHSSDMVKTQQAATGTSVSC